MGRPKKQAPEIVRVAECMDIQLHSDVMQMSDLADFPNIDDESPRNKLIVYATAGGYSQAAIAEALGVNQNTIWGIIHRIDPNGMFRLSPKAKDAFLVRLVKSRALEVMNYITPEKLKDSSAKELTGMMKDFVTINQSMTQSKHRENDGSRIDSLMEAIEVERKGDGIEDAVIIKED
jgi:hypothetical protein